MLRVRFQSNATDPRPVHWPIKHPYWITGEAGDGNYFTLVAYADDLKYIKSNWPEARNIETQEVDHYEFTGRFPKPEWFKGEE